jgi:hypothetical protein
MTAKHTPGPWRFNPVGEVRGADWNVVVCDTYGNGDDDVADADARLIAAAPELLAACERALMLMSPAACGGRVANVDSLIAEIGEAVDKAKGEKP